MARDNDISLLVTEKRGRGRPRKPDAMSNAQRQAAWRARHRAEKAATVTKNVPPAVDALQAECERLRSELAQARRQLESMPRAAAPMPPDMTAVLQRAQSPVDQGGDERRLTLSGTRFFALERLATHFVLSKRDVAERLLDWADDAVSRSFGDDDAAFKRYLDQVTKNS